MWVSFEDRQPERNDAVLVWCGHEGCVKHIEDFRSEEASNNWLLWMPCPSPTADEIVQAQRLRSLGQLSALDQELELEYGIVGNPMIKAQERTQPTEEQVWRFTERLLAMGGVPGRFWP